MKEQKMKLRCEKRPHERMVLCSNNKPWMTPIFSQGQTTERAHFVLFTETRVFHCSFHEFVFTKITKKSLCGWNLISPARQSASAPFVRNTEHVVQSF